VVSSVRPFCATQCTIFFLIIHQNVILFAEFFDSKDTFLATKCCVIHDKNMLVQCQHNLALPPFICAHNNKITLKFNVHGTTHSSKWHNATVILMKA